jgi:hypothetical protein
MDFLDLGIDLQNDVPVGLGFFLLFVLSIIILVIFVVCSNLFGSLDFFKPPALFRRH